MRNTGPMVNKRRQDDPCSVARALEEVGDWWSLLIVRQAMFGSRRFSEFQQQLGIARNILVDRLSRLVANEVLKKVDVGETGKRYEYRLTAKGRDLFPVLVALRQWGDRWNRCPDQPALVLRDCRSGQEIPRVEVRDAEGRPVDLMDVFVDDGSSQQTG